MQGRVTLLEANRPTVTTADGASYLCYLRGRIKRDIGRVMVGDWVDFEPTDAGEGWIRHIYPRKNQLLRPPMANVEGLFVVFSVSHPKGSLELLDKRLVLADLTGLAAEIIITKIDLADRDAVESLAAVYRRAGYRVWPVSGHTGEGLEAWRMTPREGIWVFTGESGVGKSTLLHRVLPDEDVVVQGLSRIGRGQQTTRTVRLYPLESFWLADSPGYTALTTTVTDPARIRDAFEEFRGTTCRFHDCWHRSEPDCGVRDKVAQGEIAAWRYAHYLALLQEWVKSY